ncbi:hypothetical protein D3C81_1846770 [compost metagenome]
MQHRQIHFLSAEPELLNERTGIQFTIKREKQRHGLCHHHRWIRHHACGGLVGKQTLLFRGKRATTLPDKLADLLSC